MFDLLHNLDFSFEISSSIWFQHSTFLIDFDCYLFAGRPIHWLSYLCICSLSNLLIDLIILIASLIFRTFCFKWTILNVFIFTNLCQLWYIKSIFEYNIWFFFDDGLLHSIKITNHNSFTNASLTENSATLQTFNLSFDCTFFIINNINDLLFAILLN